MRLIIQLKRLGKKKIHHIPFELSSEPKTLHAFITACVTEEVENYNQRRQNIELAAFLNPQQIQEQTEQGKITFGEIQNFTFIDVDKAISTALLAHKDGLYVVFVNGTEIKQLTDPIEIDEKSEIAIIRLTFLAGRMT
ncbi:MAG: hypothetical protein LBF27_08295 [Sphingobacterium sp.]|jgi:rRNA-processing protein FCF1|nr:hypothetical protein [Sphingobacterium sp.]